MVRSFAVAENVATGGNFTNIPAQVPQSLAVFLTQRTDGFQLRDKRNIGGTNCLVRGAGHRYILFCLEALVDAQRELQPSILTAPRN